MRGEPKKEAKIGPHQSLEKTPKLSSRCGESSIQHPGTYAKIQKDLGLDTGIHKKIIFNNDEISSNLDNIISELEDL